MTSLAPCRLSRSLRPWVGEVGKPAAVLLLFEELLSDRKRVLGPDHPDTLDTRHNIAAWIGRVGKPGEAMRLSEESLPDQQRVLGSDDPDTLDTRQQIAILRKELGDSG